MVMIIQDIIERIVICYSLSLSVSGLSVAVPAVCPVLEWPATAVLGRNCVDQSEIQTNLLQHDIIHR